MIKIIAICDECGESNELYFDIETILNLEKDVFLQGICKKCYKGFINLKYDY